jgi:hypothetical protein
MWHACEMREMCKILVGKPMGKRPLRSHRHRWEDGLRMDLGQIGWGGGCQVYSVASLAPWR